MVVKDFCCDGCGTVAIDEWAPSGPARPICDCGTLMDLALTPPRVDLFRPFEVDVNGTVYRIDSLQKARVVERIAEQQTRNGEGQPHIFRALSQNHSNMDRNVFGEPPRPAFSTRNRRGLPFVSRLGFLKDRSDG
jgi:hypothetical protein